MRLFAILAIVTVKVVLVTAQCSGEDSREIKQLKQRHDELQAKEVELIEAKGDRHSNMLEQQLLEVRIQLQSTTCEIARLEYEQVKETFNRINRPAFLREYVLRLKYESEREGLRLEQLRLSATPHSADDLLPLKIEIAKRDGLLARLALKIRRFPPHSISEEELQNLRQACVEAAAQLEALREQATTISP